MRVSVAALATLCRIRAATSDGARWEAFMRAHPNVRASMRVAMLLVVTSRGGATLFVDLTPAARWVLAGADAARRSSSRFTSSL